MNRGRRYIELRLPQLGTSYDFYASEQITAGELCEAVFSELAIKEAECIVFSTVKEGVIAKKRTLSEEGIRSGDKLVVFYGSRHQEENYADSSSRLYQDEQRYDQNGEIDL